MHLPRTTFIPREVEPIDGAEGVRGDIYEAFWFCKDYMAFCLEWIAFEHTMVTAYGAMAASPQGAKAVWRYHFCDDAIHEVFIPAEPGLRAICNCERCRRIDDQRRLAAWALHDRSFGFRRVRRSERSRVGVKASSLFASHGAGRVIPATLEDFDSGRSEGDDAAATGAGGEYRHAFVPFVKSAHRSSAYRSRAPPVGRFAFTFCLHRYQPFLFSVDIECCA